MDKREYAKLKKWTDTLTDEELKKSITTRCSIRLVAKLKKCMSAVMISQTYSKEKNMSGGCRGKVICSTRSESEYGIP